MPGGPQPWNRAERLALAYEIRDRAITLHQNELLAVGLYGSMAKGTDGPYSDIEIVCVLQGTDKDYTYEWTYGPWKAEVDFLAKEVILAEAAKIEGEWPLTHGSFFHLMPLYDPHHFLESLKELVLSHPPERFQEVIRSVIVGELYEWIGKLRNLRAAGRTTYLPELALGMAKYGAFVIGLANRHFYTSGQAVLEESLTLPNRPNGYEALCRIAMQGTLSDFERVNECCESFWAGVERWATEQGLRIEEPDRVPF